MIITCYVGGTPNRKWGYFEMAAEEKINVSTREEMKEKRKKAEEADQNEKRRIRIRLIPIWLRLIIIIFAMAISIVLGAMVGYGVLGDGKPLDALKPSTWQHIVDLVEKERK